VIVVSSTGITKASHKNLPLTIRPVYGYLLRLPHNDKLGLERVLAQASGAPWTSEEPLSDILPSDGSWKDELAGSGIVSSTVVIRPAFLTDGACKGTYRTSIGDQGKSFTSISRRDVAHFIVEDVMKHWTKWEDSMVSLAY
jgi:hypothetical protein